MKPHIIIGSWRKNMKKITDFIVEKRNYILIIFILLSGLCLYLGTKVKINYDISKYLPSDSETRIGMDIMNKNFKEINSSSLNVMFKDLTTSDKEKVQEELEKITNVSEVLHDETTAYNNGDYTLYIVKTDNVSDSQAAKELYTAIKETFKDQEVYFSGSISESNKDVVKSSIIALAIASAMVILIIMCDSYIEPFLFLFVIGLAVFLNKGTNIIFDDVSHITNSITAILQMALSMDYSIMLMNRYTQEKQHEKNNITAMKKALLNAFKSISSSSLTTIVGLLALVFMSFTIGRDLGFVLAKGVLFSLLTIFCCLPGLILLFDKLITKTQKKSFHFNLDWLGKLSYKFRYPILIIFILIFGGCFLLKDNLKILYTDIETDEVAKHFKESNQIAIIYNNKYEDEVSTYCHLLEKNNLENIDEVLCYGNTINEKLKVSELKPKFHDLGHDTDIEDYILKIIYYNYYHQNEPTIALIDFVNFIETNIYSNPRLNKEIDSTMSANINKLKYFISKNELTQKRSIKEMSNILGIDYDTTMNLYVLYHSQDVNANLTIQDFVKFLQKDVLTNKTYSQKLDRQTYQNINQISNFIDKNKINKKYSAQELSNLFGIPTSSVKQLLLFYYSQQEIDIRLSLTDFIKSVNAISNDQSLAIYLAEKDLGSIIRLMPLAQNENNFLTMKMNATQLHNTFQSYSATLVPMVYQAANLDENYLMSPQEFIDFTLNNFSNYLDQDMLKQLNFLKLIIDDATTSQKKTYSSSDMSLLLGIKNSDMNSLYALIAYQKNYDFQMSPYQLVAFILDNKDNKLISQNLDSNSMAKLNLLKEIMTGVNNNRKYSKKSLATMFNIPEQNMSLLYSLYDISYSNKNYQISIQNFINYLNKNVVSSKEYSSQFSKDASNKLRNLQLVMNDTLHNKKYTVKELKEVLNKFTSTDQNLLELVYLYYGSINDYNDDWQLTISELVTYLNNDILQDERFSKFIDKDMRHEITSSQEMVNDAKELLISPNYSRMIINTKLPMEGDETFTFIQDIKDSLASQNKDIYVIGDSPMAYDMGNSFGDELNLITILTMIAIYVVVALTFKSIIIPLILVLIIQCAVYVTMGILSLLGGNVYFIALLIVQSILMGATIDYAIVYTSYYKESRKKMDVLDSLKNAYNNSIHTILTSASVLIIVTLIVGNFASAIAAKICMTLSQGTLCSLILILFVLPSVLSIFDKLICQSKNEK